MAELRQSLFAYLLLAALFIMPISVFLLPSIERVRDGQLNIGLAKERLLVAKEDASKASSLLDSYPKQLEVLVREGDLMYAVSSSDATNRFQNKLKPILLKHQANLRQTRPSVEIIELGLSKSILELNLSMPLESFDSLMGELSQMTPRIQVDLANARRITLDSNSRDLELNLKLSIWFVDNTSFPSTIRAEIDQHLVSELGSEDSQVEMPSESTVTARMVKKTDYVASLFDRVLRRRLASPSVDYYSIAAITVSPKGKLALIKIAEQPGTYRIKNGDMLDVWTIDAIDESGVDLSFNKRKERLEWSR